MTECDDGMYDNQPRTVATCSSSSDISARQRFHKFQPHNRTLEVGSFLECVVESTTVTHSSADWWDILLPLA